MPRTLLLVLLLFCLSSCISNVNSRIRLANEIAGQNSLERKIVKTSKFSILTYSKFDKSNSNKTLNIYIEGDGFAWRNKQTPSLDPTPKNPISLKLAAVDSSSNVLYIARPCQYVDIELEKNCTNEIWTNARFSSDVVTSIDEIVSHYVVNNKINKVNLYGYSGGGAIAVLVAAKRKDIKFIKTIAANLDHKKLTEAQGLSPLSKSLNPIDFVKNVKNIPQLHIIGEKDNIIPSDIIINYVKILNSIGGNANFRIAEEANHSYKNWSIIWTSKDVKNMEVVLIKK